MSADHDHPVATKQNQKQLTVALILTSIFLVAEVIGGLVTGSLALLSDAAHMFTDASALAISLAAVQIAKRAADSKRTFGYHRFEILAAAFNAMMLFAVAMYILYEAYQRFKAPPEIQSGGMLVIAIFGLVVNLISMKLLSAGKDASLNVKGAYLEVWSDMLGSIGVIIGALIIRFTGWVWVDAVIAVAIGLWVLPRTWILLKESLNILLEGVPEGMDLEEIIAQLASSKGVVSVHDVHLWALTSGKVSLTAHVVYEASLSPEQQVLPSMKEVLAEKYKIFHTTIQFETTHCGQADEDEHYSEAGHAHTHE